MTKSLINRIDKTMGDDFIPAMCAGIIVFGFMMLIIVCIVGGRLLG